MSATMRRGAILLWVVVTIAVVAAVAAVAAPLLVQINDTQRVALSARVLRDVARAVDSFNAVVERGTGRPAMSTTPARLSLLTAPVANGGAAGCTGQRYDTSSVVAWNRNAPFAPYVMPVEGLYTPLGRINDAPSRSPTAVGQGRRSASDPYFIQIASVDVKMARLLDVYVDGVADANADTVQYDAPRRDSSVLLSYRVSLRRTPAC
jgi:type II secretory pathway pseudopilin PulG